jgi:hypothetical protein
LNDRFTTRVQKPAETAPVVFGLTAQFMLNRSLSGASRYGVENTIVFRNKIEKQSRQAEG